MTWKRERVPEKMTFFYLLNAYYTPKGRQEKVLPLLLPPPYAARVSLLRVLSVRLTLSMPALSRAEWQRANQIEILAPPLIRCLLT